jgi:ankyrin repeat protein
MPGDVDMDACELRAEGDVADERKDCGRTMLHVAVMKNDLETVKLLLASGVDANARTRADSREEKVSCDCTNERFCFHVADEYGNEVKDCRVVEQNALHLAAKHSAVDIVELLLNSVRDVNEGAEDESTALHFATQNSTAADADIRVCELLLKSGANLEARNKEEKTALYLAVKFDKLALANYLVSMGANVNAVTKNRSAPLYSALINYNLELVELLLAHKATTDLRNRHDEDPLFYVLRVGCKGEARLRFVRLLLENGVDVDSRNCHGSTALHVAVQEKDEGLAALLLQSNCPVDSKDFHDFSPLSVAVCMNLESMAKLLLERGANANDLVRTTSILELAIVRRKEAMVRLLLEFRADVNIGCERNKPVAAACLHKNTRIMQLLIDNGADINYKDKKGMTPLMRVIKEPNYPMMRHLLARGAAINDRDRDGNTAFHILFDNSMHTKENIIEYLLDEGADVNIENNSGHTPFRYMMFKCFTKGEVFVFVKHIALLMARHAYVNPKNIKHIKCDNTCHEYLNSCLLELSRMKQVQIHEKCSYFEIITKKHSALLSLFNSDTVLSTFELGVQKNKFFNYSDVLARHFYTKKNRLSFLKQSILTLDNIFRSQLPPEILEYICQYLSNEDMKKYLLTQTQTQ